MKIDILGKKAQLIKAERIIDPLTADLINVKAISEQFLYTRDDFLHCFIKIEPISIELYSLNEKKQLSRKLTAEMSGEKDAFKLLIVPRPIDLSSLVAQYNVLLAESKNIIAKTLLRDEIAAMNRYILSGEVVEKQYYLMLWESHRLNAEKELYKRASDFVERFRRNQIECKIINENEIVLLCNLINNPTYINFENNEYLKNIPLLNGN